MVQSETVKLTRIEKKMEIFSRPSSKSEIKPQNCVKNKQFSIHKKSQTTANQQKVMQEELKNIFLIKDTKSTNYRLRKENLCFMAKQQKKTFLEITEKKD